MLVGQKIIITIIISQIVRARQRLQRTKQLPRAAFDQKAGTEFIERKAHRFIPFPDELFRPVRGEMWVDVVQFTVNSFSPAGHQQLEPPANDSSDRLRTAAGEREGASAASRDDDVTKSRNVTPEEP